MTHADLVERAVAWLRGTMGCGVALAEPQTHGVELPDGLGWISDRVIMVECKASRSDFLRDRKKPHRYWSESGIGTHRYYFAPPGLIAVDELPERWGLAECHPTYVRHIHKAERFFEHNTGYETNALLWWIRKLQAEHEG